MDTQKMGNPTVRFASATPLEVQPGMRNWKIIREGEPVAEISAFDSGSFYFRVKLENEDSVTGTRTTFDLAIIAVKEYVEGMK